LPVSQNWKRFHDLVPQGSEEFRNALLRELEDVTRELAILRTLLDNYEIFCLTKPFPDFRELHGKQLSKQRSHTDVGEIIPFTTDRAAAGGIVAMLGMIESLLHEPRERLRASVANFVANNLDQRGTFIWHVQPPTLNAQRSTLNWEN
jgi:hypothetical protein